MAAVPHFHLPIGAAPSLRAMEDEIAALPAVDRAALSWAVPKVRSVIDAYLASDLTRRAERELVVSLAGALADLPYSGDKHQIATALRLDHDATLMRDRFSGPTGDSVEWALRTWAAFATYLGTVELPDPRAVAAEPMERSAWLASDACPLRLQGLLLAFSEATIQSRPAALLAEIADAAYDAAQALLAALRAVGVVLDPFAGESKSERGARARRYLVSMRGLFTESDVQVLEASRLRSLR